MTCHIIDLRRDFGAGRATARYDEAHKGFPFFVADRGQTGSLQVIEDVPANALGVGHGLELVAVFHSGNAMSVGNGSASHYDLVVRCGA